MKNIKCLLLVCSALLSMVANSQDVKGSIFDSLKIEPATRYEVGKLSLNVVAAILSQGSKGQRLKGTSFEILGMGVDEGPSHLNLLVKLEGKAEDMTQEQCVEFKGVFNQNPKFENTAKLLWSDLSEADYEALKSFVGLSVELISAENKSFKISC
jgi:hypothetical protein